MDDTQFLTKHSTSEVLSSSEDMDSEQSAAEASSSNPTIVSEEDTMEVFSEEQGKKSTISWLVRPPAPKDWVNLSCSEILSRLEKDLREEAERNQCASGASTENESYEPPRYQGNVQRTAEVQGTPLDLSRRQSIAEIQSTTGHLSQNKTHPRHWMAMTPSDRHILHKMEQLNMSDSGIEFNQDCNCADCRKVVNGFDMEHITDQSVAETFDERYASRGPSPTESDKQYEVMIEAALILDQESLGVSSDYTQKETKAWPITPKTKRVRKRIARLKDRFYGAQYNPGLPTESSDRAMALQTLMTGTRNAYIEVSKLIHQFNRTRQSHLDRMDGLPFSNRRMVSDPTLISQEDIDSIKNLVRQGFELCHSKLLIPLEDMENYTAMLRNAFGVACSIKEMLRRVDRVLTLKGQIHRTVKTLNQMVSQPSCFSEPIYLKEF